MSIRPKPLSPAEALSTFINDEMLERRVSFPAQITAINTDAGDGALLSVDVLPLIRQTLSQENTDELVYRDLPILANVPVVFPHSTVSGYSLTIPIQIGDQVLIVIADRSIDEWQASGAVSRPVESTTPRAHDLTDAIAIIGISCDVKNVKQYDFDKICIRNADKTQRVCVSDTQVDIVSGGSSIIVDTTSITQSATTVSISGNTVDVSGDPITLTAGANSITIGSAGIAITGPLTINGVDFDQFFADYNVHTHEVIQPGPLRVTTAPL